VNLSIFRFVHRSATGRLLWAVLLALAAGTSPRARADGEITLHDGWALQSSAHVKESGAQISQVGYEAGGWYKATAPRTVFAVLVDNGVYKDPFFGMNLRTFPGVDYKVHGGGFAREEMSATSPYAVPWWYRSEFEVPAGYQGKTIWLAFRGINYRANIWINGKQLAGSDTVVGAFRRYEFDVTSLVKAGKKNAVAVEVSAPHAGELGITFVDWNPTAPDKEMGLWQEVVLSATGRVAIRHSFVDTKLDLPAAGTARLTVRAELRNTTDKPVRGTLQGKITGAAEPIEFSQAVELEANQTSELTFTPEKVAVLDVKNPRLWWPYQMGAPYLHRLSLNFVTDAGAVSDVQNISFGMVQMDSEMTPTGGKLLKVNGKPVLVRGGGWTPDMMLRVDEKRREAEFRYVKEMGLNTVRLEGKLEDEAFLDRADRDGILVMAGWCCCDAWEQWGKWNEENKRVSVDSLRDQMLRLRQHPSLLVWLNGSDNPPPPDRELAYLKIEKETNWPKPLISSATAKKTETTGDTGVKMSGPYEYVSPNYWLTDTKAGGAYAFNTETSPGAAIPPVEGLQAMLPPDKLWPINEFWEYHAGGGKFGNIKIYAEALEKHYGKATDAADFAWKSQAVAYDGERAMFEAYGRNKYNSTGVIQWMLNNAWPGIIWHLYDYDLRPAGGYFGSKKALEPVHVQFSYDDRRIAVVNGKQEPVNDLKLVAKLYDTSMKERFSQEAKVNVGADAVARSFIIPEPRDISKTYFLNLGLFSSSGELVSRNFYWLSTEPDVLDFSKTTWFYTPLTSFADMTALADLPKTALKASMKLSSAGKDAVAHVTVQNPGSGLAFLVRLRLLHKSDNSEVLPIFWDDNYFPLLPGEKREITVHVRQADLGESRPVLAVDGFNVTPTTVQ
jgi:exo-1,4-beta-D-glucosaminidase